MYIFSWQLVIEVRDSEKPLTSTRTTLTIPVRRNVHAPVFDAETFEAAILENVPLASLVTSVKAEDDDDDVLTYEITDDVSNELSRQFFFIIHDTGAIHVKRSLREDVDLNTEYRVRNGCDYQHYYKN